MGYEFHWEPPHGLVRKFFGRVSDEEVSEANRHAEASPSFDALRYVVNDFTECTGANYSAGSVDEIAAVDCAAANFNPRIRIAIAATHPEVVVASRMYAANPLNPFETRIFTSVADARAWLGQHGTVMRAE